MKTIESILDPEPLLDLEIMALCQWASDYYHYPLGDVLLSTLPKLLREGKPAQTPAENYFRPIPQSTTSLIRAKQQLALFEFLLKYPDGLTSKQIQEAGFSTAVIRHLLEKEFIEKIEKDTFTAIIGQGLGSTLQLNAEQQSAKEQICETLTQFAPFLLEGVTGSGKTEVYFHCIEQVLALGRQVLILVPEIGLTPQTIHRFAQRFSVPLGILHSGLNDTERLTNWLYAKQDRVKIIIGTRSAIFTPFANLGMIIIDESHDLSFKQQEGFRYSARDLAMIRAQQKKCPVILGTATPSFETLHNVTQKRFQWLQLSRPAAAKAKSQFTVLDIRGQKLQEGLSQQLLDRIENHLALENQILLFLNRRGFAPTLMCHDCGWSAKCNRCDAKMTYHLQPRYLHCHHCNSTKAIDTRCPECNSTQIQPLGIGTERVEEFLKAKFPDTEVIRIDRDTISRKGQLQAAIDKVKLGKKQVLVGTQMLAKGHHFPNVTLVAILDIDSSFFSSDFRASERMAQLILQVAGRAGREEKPGEVVLQTRHPEHPLLITLIKDGYRAFSENQLNERKIANFPPFAHFALLRAESAQMEKAKDFLTAAKQFATPIDTAVSLLGPIPAPMAKRKGHYRAHLLIHATQRKNLHRLLDQLITHLYEKQRSSVRWSLDVDPLEMF